MKRGLWWVLLLAACGEDDTETPAGDLDEGPPGDAAPVDSGADAAPDAAAPDGGPTERGLRVVTFNVGNPDTDEPNYPLRLSYQDYEDFVGERIRELQADVVALQEVLPPQTCAAFDEQDPARTCFDAASRPAAARRLLGPEYTVVCDRRKHVECVGVHRAFGTVDGVPDGEMADAAETPPLPLPGCSYFEGTCTEDTCDDESTVSALTVRTDRGPLRVVHVHPNASGIGAGGFYFGRACRQAQIDQAFDLLAADEMPTLVLGDWNFDPDSPLYAEERAGWTDRIGDGRRFHDHDQRGPDGVTRVPTIGTVRVAIDHVVSDFAEGTCEVFADPRLDDGHDFSALPGGEQSRGRIDHRAILCPLVWP